MSGCTRIDSDLYDAVIRPPLVRRSRSHPTVAYLWRIRAAVNINMYGILLCLVEVLRIYYHARKLEAVGCSHIHEFSERILGCVEIRSLHIGDYVGDTDVLA